ncbi:3-oxoacyl-ACP reductase [Nitratireductor aestuarii]|uniref:3-oxoacyl-ACP reductase n=1 Tax=Nitratireductor aestuarii TaxID=1735103 RepID=A0A916W3N7_9HYPH|nr:SDR family NAD(P)-dependent oxidoreductase [Nitratireductor aestuarii]GGA63348.1 3-oxoacyl-ACP reductase [Nitratireductor aestuarii]
MTARRFEGKAALVTGAASGIGRATAVRLAEEGASVILADVNADGLAKVCEAISAAGGTAKHLIYDAADGDASAAMAEQAASLFGKLDVVVCNAGIYRRNHFTEISAADWSFLYSVNLFSAVRIMQATIPHLRKTKGNVVATSSTSAIHGIAYAAHYASAKAAIIALIKSLAVEYSGSGIRFNAICPGKVNTGMGAAVAALEGQDPALIVRQPKLAGRTEGGTPEDLAASIAYLASDDARYVTGSVLVVDGAQNIG